MTVEVAKANCYVKKEATLFSAGRFVLFKNFIG